jgi:hypothetical protein
MDLRVVALDRVTPGLTIVSGGQTGVDRAVLDIACELGYPTGGWCPKGRRAEDGPIPALTLRLARELGKPHRLYDLLGQANHVEVRSWVKNLNGWLNVAGPRESTAPGVYAKAKHFLLQVLS